MTEMITLTRDRSGEAAKRRRRAAWRFWIGKAVQAVLTLLFVSIVIFFVTQAMPGDVAQVILGTNATPEKIEQVRKNLGLDQPCLLYTSPSPRD